MDTEKVYTTSLRLYKSRPVHHQAYRYLKEYNKDIFKTKAGLLLRIPYLQFSCYGFHDQFQ